MVLLFLSLLNPKAINSGVKGWSPLLYHLILQQRVDGVSKSVIKKGTITMTKNAHLTYDDRLTIQSSLAVHLSFKAIGLILGKDPSTIAKEVKNHLKFEAKGSFNPCLHRKTCTHNRDVCKPCSKKYSQNCRTCDEGCYKTCPDFEEKHCLHIRKPPYVCNGCMERHGCKLQQGQSIHHICIYFNLFGFVSSTLKS